MDKALHGAKGCRAARDCRARACDELMSQEPDEEDAELRRLHSEVDARERDIRDMSQFEQRQEGADRAPPGLELAADFLPADAEQDSGDFYLVAEGPQDSTVLVVGDVVGHGSPAERRAAFVRTAFAATAPF
jgi:hypothetical protein